MTIREFDATERSRRDWRIRLLIGLLVSLIAALLGPFATYESLPVAQRALYWSGLVFGLMLPAVAIRTFVMNRLDGSPLQLDLIAAHLITVVVAPFIWLVNVYVMGFDVRSVAGFVEHVACVLLVLLLPVVLRLYLRMEWEKRRAKTAVPVDVLPTPTDQVAAVVPNVRPQADVEEPAFMRRLAPDKRGELLRVSADGHQLQVYTSNGPSRVRMRFGDALEELGAFKGAAIHRSHWVAFDAVRSVQPDGRRFRVVLGCGTELPVSEARVGVLREAGLLPD